MGITSEIILNTMIAHLQRRREMNNIQINIVQLSFLQWYFQARSNQFWSMKSAPKLSGLKNETLNSVFIHFSWIISSNKETIFYS